MTAVLERRPLYRRPVEIGRRVAFFLLEFGLKAYGAAAAVSVALSDAETVRGKGYDALNAIPNLVERYRQAKYVVEHRKQVQAALDYAHEHAPDPRQLETAVQKSSETLDRIRTTYSEVTQAKDAFVSIRPTNILERLPRVKEHVETAWAAKPSLDSIEHLSERAQNVETFLKQLGLEDPYVRSAYADLLTVMDNFASDEIVATLALMGAAFALGYILGMAAGYWGRRGRPGFIAGTLQRWGTRHFKDWYVQNLEYAMSWPLYAVARERIQRDIVADPQEALDPEALQALERYFERRLPENPTASPGSVTAPRPIP
jgi:hypothetical protein